MVMYFVGSSHTLSEVCVSFHEQIVAMESKHEARLTSTTDMEYGECKSNFGLLFDNDGDGDGEGSCHSSILEGEGHWSRPPSSSKPEEEEDRREKSGRSGSEEGQDPSRTTFSSSMSWDSISPLTPAGRSCLTGTVIHTGSGDYTEVTEDDIDIDDSDPDPDLAFFWNHAWLSTPFQYFDHISTTVTTPKLFADHVPIGDLHPDSTPPAVGAVSAQQQQQQQQQPIGVISPIHLVQHHHQHPQSTCLHLPKLKYPGTLVAVSCFTHLQHLAIGCIGSEADCSVTDYDMAVVVDSLGQQLLSVRLLKLHSLSTATLTMIMANCANLTILVVFGCDGMRVNERNNMNIQRAFKAFENPIEGGQQSSPRLFVPLLKPPSSSSSSITPPAEIEEYIFSHHSEEASEGGVIPPAGPARRLDLLDLRYSIDLNEELLYEIMQEFHEISM